MAPGDYTAHSDTVITFNPTETTKTITVLVNGDKQVEDNETFNVTLSNPSNATITTATGLGTINNDDAAPVTTPFSASTWAGRAIINRPTAATDANSDTLTYSAGSTPPTHGTLGGVLGSDGLFLYTPDNTGYTGPDSFTINASDGANSTPLTVTVQISAAPTAGTLIYTSVGASDANAVGASAFNKGYTSLLLGRMNTMYGAGKWALSNRGVNGFTTADLRRVVGGQSVLTLTAADAPRAVTLWIGPNDVVQFFQAFPNATISQTNTFVSQFSTDYGVVLSSLKGALNGSPAGIVAANVPKIGNLPVAGPPKPPYLDLTAQQKTNINNLCGALSSSIGTIASNQSVPVVDLFSNNTADPTDSSADGFHPSDGGYQKLADAYWPLMRPRLNRAPVAATQTISTDEGHSVQRHTDCPRPRFGRSRRTDLRQSG